jgi:hypothetical protein
MKLELATDVIGVASHALFASFFICEETPPPENVRVVFFIMPYRCWAFGKMIGGEIRLPTSPENAKAIYWSPLPLVPESADSARNAIKESM